MLVPRPQAPKLLYQPRRPTHTDRVDVLRLAKAENDLFRVLRQEARSGFKPFGLPVYLNSGSDRVPVRFCASQLESNGSIRSCAVILQHAYLRAKSALQKYVGPAIAIEIRDGKGAAVFGEIEPTNTRKVKVPIAAPDVEYV